MKGIRLALAFSASISASSSARRASSSQSPTPPPAPRSLPPRPPQRDAPRQRAAHGPADRDVGGRAGRGIAGALDALALGLRELALGEIRQFEIVEEQIDELVAGEHEAERVLAVAFARAAVLARRPGRTRKIVALDELLVPGQHHVARSAFAAETRLVHAVERDSDFAALQDILDVPVLRGLLDGALNQGLGPTQEPLPVLKTLAARIQPPVNDVHGIHCSHPPQPACFTRMYHSTSRRTWRSV